MRNALLCGTGVLRWREQTVGMNPLQAVQGQLVPVELRAGEEVPISCQAHGDPAPTQIRWLHNGVHQPRFDNVWVLRLSGSHAGLWRCDVKSVCRSLTMSFRVEVRAELSMSQPLDQLVNVGEPAAFECVVRSLHKPNIFVRMRPTCSSTAPFSPPPPPPPPPQLSHLCFHCTLFLDSSRIRILSMSRAVAPAPAE